MAERIGEAALVSDAYIDTLLARHARRPVALPAVEALPEPGLRHASELLAGSLPRLHPSFAFEEALAARLRHGLAVDAPAQVVALLPPSLAAPALRLDRRVVLSVGGAAIASGMSVAAVYAWRHAARRWRPGRQVIA